MLPEKTLMNKNVWIGSILVGCSSGMEARKTIRDLIKTLSAKELQRLNKHRDLVKRVWEICGYTKVEMRKLLSSKDYNFDFSDYEDDVYIQAEGTTSLEAEWSTRRKKEKGRVRLPWPGWYLSYNDDFMPWARNLLLQEVRENLWVRVIEEAVLKKTEEDARIAEEGYGYGCYI
jgi:hypothetical protein